METRPPNVVRIDAYRDKRRQDEIDALNFGTQPKPGSLDDEPRRADATSIEDIERTAVDGEDD